MPRYVGKPLDAKVHVIDANGDPVTSAAVSWKVYDDEDAGFSSGTMTHFADGIYTCTWTPNAVGEWTAQCYSSNPKFRKSFTYYVEAAP